MSSEFDERIRAALGIEHGPIDVRAVRAGVTTLRREYKTALGLEGDNGKSRLRPTQARAARAMLGLSEVEAAGLAGIPVARIFSFEWSGMAAPVERKALQRAYERHGIVFSWPRGVAVVGWRA